MSDGQLSILQQEWITLQNQFDSYEKYSLVIKLFNILVTSVCFATYMLGRSGVRDYLVARWDLENLSGSYW